MPAPQHARAAPFAAPASTEGNGNGGGGGQGGELGGMVPGDTGYAHLDAGSRFQQEQASVQHVDRDSTRIPRPTGSDADGRTSASPPLPIASASLAPPPPPPPPPPPVLSAAQQEHLRQLQQQQQQRDRYAQQQQQQHMAVDLVLPSPSRHRIELADPQPSPRGPPRQQRHWQSGPPHHPGVLSLPRYASAMPAGAPLCPSPVVKVPIYSTLSEAIDHQQKQQEQQQRQQQRHQVHQIGAMPAAAAAAPPPPPPSLSSRASPVGKGSNASFVFEAPTTPGCYSPRLAMVGNRQQPQPQQRGFNDGTMPAPEGFFRPQQQQQQRVLHRARSLPAEEGRGGAATAAPGGYDGNGRASPRRGMAPQNRSFNAPVTMAMPLQEAPSQASMQPPAAPPAGLRLQMCGAANAPMSAPVTPVMVYAYPHGYMMAYPPVNVQNVQTPRSTRSQASKAWDPYECVSPSGESASHAGFGLRGKETRASSLESSPVASSSRMSVSSRESMTKPDGDGQHQDHDVVSQGQRSRASSVLSDVIDRGFYDDNNAPQQSGERDRPAVSKPSLSLSLSLSELQGNENGGENVLFETPSRHQARGSHVTSVGGVVDGGDDKENAGAVGGGRREKGGSNGDGVDAPGGCSVADKQLSGQKRGGGDIEIEKQKSFTGSYFQVSPGSFLQSTKRQRNFA